MITPVPYPVATHCAGHRPRPSVLLDPSHPLRVALGGVYPITPPTLPPLECAPPPVQICHRACSVTASSLRDRVCWARCAPAARHPQRPLSALGLLGFLLPSAPLLQKWACRCRRHDAHRREDDVDGMRSDGHRGKQEACPARSDPTPARGSADAPLFSTSSALHFTPLHVLEPADSDDPPCRLDAWKHSAAVALPDDRNSNPPPAILPPAHMPDRAFVQKPMQVCQGCSPLGRAQFQFPGFASPRSCSPSLHASRRPVDSRTKRLKGGSGPHRTAPLQLHISAPALVTTRVAGRRTPAESTTTPIIHIYGGRWRIFSARAITRNA
ncbi:hypothetical protein C8T65DRAFT_138817 [Cerioporus squamosus]|nr:hypothetical protein C8T65DRAFT_138817 [Cerioporus squamosus]